MSEILREAFNNRGKRILNAREWSCTSSEIYYLDDECFGQFFYCENDEDDDTVLTDVLVCGDDTFFTDW
ncbi:MAG: hypothetical protein AAGF85_02990 [Bacteroidota bacterium]